MRRAPGFLTICLLALALAGCGDPKPASHAAAPITTTPTPTAAAHATGPCRPARVHQPPYPGHGQGLETLPWITGRPRAAGLVGLVWFFSPRWGHIRHARIWAGGKSPDGANTKLLWVFLAPHDTDGASDQLRVSGRRLDGPGHFTDTFAGVGYEGSDGAPSYASIINIPRPGCWRLTLTTGSLRATVDMRAIPLPD